MRGWIHERRVVDLLGSDEDKPFKNGLSQIQDGDIGRSR